MSTRINLKTIMKYVITVENVRARFYRNERSPVTQNNIEYLPISSYYTKHIMAPAAWQSTIYTAVSGISYYIIVYYYIICIHIR